MTVTRVVFADPSEEERGRIRAFLESRFGEEITVVYPGMISSMCIKGHR